MAEVQARAKKQSGTETRQRQRRLVIRLAPDEWAHVVRAADAAGLTMASYGRARMLAKSTTRAVRRAPVDAEVLARVLAQLGRVGGNLHQLVRHLNFGEYDALADVAEVVTELRHVAAGIMGALGRPPRANGD